jgi:hypothetical protein
VAQLNHRPASKHLARALIAVMAIQSCDLGSLQDDRMPGPAAVHGAGAARLTHEADDRGRGDQGLIPERYEHLGGARQRLQSAPQRSGLPV